MRLTFVYEFLANTACNLHKGWSMISFHCLKHFLRISLFDWGITVLNMLNFNHI